MSKTLYALKGLPASGKSTHARKMLADFGKGNAKIANKDQLRAMLDDGQWSRENEKMVLKIRDLIIKETLESGKHLICDDTNLAPKHMERLKQLAHENGADFEVVDFTHVSVEECIDRDLKRAASVGEKVIRGMYEQFLKLAPPVVEYDPMLPDCVIIDVDGTMAQMNGRGPFEWGKVGEDQPRKPILEVIEGYLFSQEPADGGTPDWVVFVLSGRDGCCREETYKWLEKHFPRQWDLHMRQAGDMRQDTVIKRELYEAHIAGKYNVKAIFDDRPQVIRLWQALGFGDRIFNVGDGREF